MAARKTIKVVAERTEICRECRAVHSHKVNGLRCHRHSPVFVYDPATGTSNAQWPEVNPDDWCLDFAPHLSS